VGRSQGSLDEVVTAAGALGAHVLTITGDVTSSVDMHAAVEATVSRFGQLDTLVPNAGIWDFQRSVTRLSGEELSVAFDELFAINVKGYLLAVEAGWKELVKTNGSVIMTLSNSSFYSNGGGPLYTASKFAARGLVTELAYELAPKVRVNGVAVGGMRTDLRGPESIGLKERSIAASFNKSEVVGDNPYLPLRHSSVEPEDFTGPYVLLASAKNSGVITGHIINADGGIGVRGFRTAAGGEDL
jgi:2,3-dihydroxy-2,3-dihydrophenylpropionate dehydrogenase